MNFTSKYYVVQVHVPFHNMHRIKNYGFTFFKDDISLRLMNDRIPVDFLFLAQIFSFSKVLEVTLRLITNDPFDKVNVNL